MTHETRDREGFLPIEDYGVIGDQRSAALVSADGSIDFCCLPRFDSPSIFAALLDHERGGYFSLAPRGEIKRRQQMYLPDTNVLMTRFMSEHGVAEVVDFMPPTVVSDRQAIVRLARVLRGEHRFRLELVPRFDYARTPVRVRRAQGAGGPLILEPAGGRGPVLRLDSPLDLAASDDRITAELTLCAGDSVSFVLEVDADLEQAPLDGQRAFAQAVDYWRGWANRSAYRGRWRESVVRSALVLELLTSHDHGMMVAAPTFGLPEAIGKGRNWDYRYGWIRDVSYAVRALNRLGLLADTDDLIGWSLARMCEGDGPPPMGVLYGLDGRRVSDEWELPHLRGYRHSQPVRVGNAAGQQLQLDIYGELIDALHLHERHTSVLYHDLWERLVEIMRWLEDCWREPDRGIWELRGDKCEYVHSRLMCWVAFDRAIRLAQDTGRPAPIQRWRETRDAIYHDIWSRFWSPRLSAFTQCPGVDVLDAAVLVMPLVGFVSDHDPRWRSTLAAIDERLVDDSMVYRFRSRHGVDAREGTFSLCSFWYVECLSRAGQLDEARLVFEKMLGHANHLGLFAEELGPCGEHLGNFPQGLAHLGLISAACDLDARLSARDERARSPGR